ncbi:MAG: ketoacid-binding protein [Promethearchaeota archaeon]|nr:MAG: ketoacid-binding protein [Candidatus Lokiarchaeota archaeon]
MVEKEIINANTPKAGPYSHAVKAGEFLFVSGQGPKPGTEDIQEQTITALGNVKAILEVAGAKISDIVKVTVFLKDINDFKKMNRAYKRFFKDNGVDEDFPARSAVEVANLPAPTMKIEVDVIAKI